MDLVFLMLLLAARLPFVDGAVGHDRALEFHRKLGKPALYLLLAHGLLVATGYGMAEGLNPVSEAVSLWVLVPDMWLAFVSMALFIAVVVTSLVAVRRRFPYEFWYFVHLLTYLAVATALPHQFSVGGLFAAGTWQRWYWLLLYIGTGSALVWFRLAVPVMATFRHQLTVRRVVRVAPDVVSIEMSGLRLNELTGAGGRFFVWRFLAPGMWWQAHPYSLSAEPQRAPAIPGRLPRQDTLRITVRNLGTGSSRLASLRPGTKVAIEGPYGVFSTAARSRDRIVMIGAGIGITPLRALLESTPFAPGQATVLLRGSSEGELFLGDGDPGVVPETRRHSLPPDRPPRKECQEHVAAGLGRCRAAAGLRTGHRRRRCLHLRPIRLGAPGLGRREKLRRPGGTTPLRKV
ncbi:ferric reductase-like transmembrane domain-containing protein [Arthrobacter sp. NA-172]|uniref:ferredoxin reductase family protein n=1 Tax=Arthrobacter sp. NA-172 TaxID=3367524 RepID=UPI003754EB69